MGTGFSTVCSGKRSVIISNSIGVKRSNQGQGHPEIPLSREPSKLHPCVSRDSGIVENDFPHHLSLSRAYLDDDVVNDNVNEESDGNNNFDLIDEPFKPSRPHSCRLGNRKATQNRNNGPLLVEEDKLVRYVRKTKSSGGDSIPSLFDDDDSLEKEDSFYQDSRPTTAKSRVKTGRSKRAKTAESRRTPLVDDLEFSSDDSDTESEFWTIPDETYSLNDKGSTRKGWVGDDEVASSGTLTPTSRSTDILDYYRIVQESYSRYDANLAKKASERSISSIILMPVDGNNSPTQSSRSSQNGDGFVLPLHLQQRMDNLVTSFTDTLCDKTDGLIEEDYLLVMRKLRHHLVDFVGCCIASNVTPRTPVSPEKKCLMIDTAAPFQLLPADEEILEASERQLAKRLARKGANITSEDIALEFGDHMRTIEQLQHVRDNKRQTSGKPDDGTNSSNQPSSVRKTSPGSKRKKTSSVLDTSPPSTPENDSDSTIENGDVEEQNALVTPSVRKSTSLDESQLQGTFQKSDGLTGDEYMRFLESLERIWNQRARLVLEDLLTSLKTMRQNLGDKNKDPNLADKKFCQNLIPKLQQNALKKDEFAKTIIEHMSRTGSVRVRAIQVSPAPLNRTCSLNDAVSSIRTNESSAGSNASRRSEPDMRRWKLENEFGLKNASRRDIARAMTAKKRSATVQTHGLAPMAPLREGAEERIALTKVDEMEGKYSVKSRPDSGIAVSMSSGSYSSYSSTDVAKETETDDMDEACITETSEMLERVDKVKIDQHNDVKSLVAAITKGLTTQQLKAQALYCWLTNINLNKISRMRQKSNTPVGKMKQLAEKKITYASLYQELCRAAGLKCEKIEGYVKSKEYLPGNTVQSPKFQHTWCAVQLDGHFRLVDPMYGARREKFFMDHFFMTAPDNLMLSHYPKDKKWLLMNQTINVEAFEDSVKAWPAMFHFNIRPLSMKSVIRTYDGKLSITVLLRNVAVIPHLEYAGPGNIEDEDALADNIDEEIRDVENAETFHITLPQEGNYYFTLYAHVLEDELDVPVFQYRVEYVDELL